MSTLDPTLRAALDKTLDKGGIIYDLLTEDERAALAALRAACPKPPWLPTGDGIATCVGVDGDRRLFHVRDGKVSRVLRPDGTLRYPADPATFDGTWEPYVHEVTTEQIIKAALDADCRMYTVRAVLPALGCREVMTR